MTVPLAFVGMTTLDVVQAAGELPELNTKGRAHQAYLDVGGPAANAAITARILGSSVVLDTALGSGPASDLVTEILATWGVAVRDHGGEVDLPLASIWITGAGDRTLLSTAVASPGPQYLAGFTESAAVLSDGLYPDLARAAVRAATDRGVPVVLDCGSWRDVFAELLPLATIVIAGDEFRFPEDPRCSARSMLVELVRRYQPRFAAVTRGNRPVLWAATNEIGAVEVPAVAVVDTLGAGDVLHGAFMHFAFDRGLADRDALRSAVEVASHSCEHFGARRGVESCRRVDP